MTPIELQILSDANACPCGGHAVFHAAGGPGDVPHVHCSNHRCGRIIPAVFRTVAETVEIWNQDVREDSCPAHDWFRQPDDTFICHHCGKTCDPLAAQAKAMDMALESILAPTPAQRWLSSVKTKGRWDSVQQRTTAPDEKPKD